MIIFLPTSLESKSFSQELIESLHDNSIEDKRQQLLCKCYWIVWYECRWNVFSYFFSQAWPITISVQSWEQRNLLSKYTEGFTESIFFDDTVA